MIITIKKTSSIILILLLSMSCSAQQKGERIISKSKMNVNWYFNDDRIYFEMSAPTDGWVAIGFNKHSGIQGTYLIMGHVKNKEANIAEYYTISPGNYKSIESLNETSNVKHIEGEENYKKTTLKFSLPIKPSNKYQKDLSKGNKYTMLMAYSLEDDFQHHSIMRTSIKVTL